MTAGKMHENEVDTNVDLVRRLLAAQFPQWADLPLARVASAGTDNTIYRLGADLCVRMPRIDWALGQADKEFAWLPRLAPLLPLDVPVPLAQGEPGQGYPWRWSVYRWLEGTDMFAEMTADTNAAGDLDLRQTAVDLAGFISALQQIDPTGGPRAVEHGLRGAPLVQRDADTRAAIAALRGLIDAGAATRAWEAALRAPEWGREPVWFHGDLLPGNVLVRRGRVSAIIDFAGLGVGDPACDLMMAWGGFSDESRTAFRAALAVDEATWARGRGMALSQALIFIPYYLETNPVGVAYARHVVDEVLADWKTGG
jgi:aminoglycoside phosphotransferase (APT) family kinase protein